MLIGFSCLPCLRKTKITWVLKEFKLLSLLTKKKIVALGGASQKNIKKLALTNCHGFAGISFFE